MWQRFWKAVERLGWIAGVVGVLLAFYAYFVPPPAGNEDKKPTELPVQPAEPVASAPPPPLASVPPPQPPENLPTEIADRRTVASAFGNLFDLTGSSRFIAPHAAGNATFIKRVDKLVVSGDSLVWTLWQKEQDASEPWVTVAEPAYPLPGSRNPRTSKLEYSCRAVLRELNPPMPSADEYRLSCAAGECWQCNGTVEYTFDAPKETLDKPHNEIQIHPNKSADVETLSAAIERLQTPGTSYRR